MQPLGERAVVLGASMGGLLVARVLSELYEHVTVLDRDELPTTASHRQGVPQSRHPHGLLSRGREVLEELFPGLTEELVGLGARVGDGQLRVRWYNDGHLLLKHPSDIQGIAVSRPLLESVVRTRVLGLPNVDQAPSCRVLRLLAPGGRVTGVRVRGRDGHEVDVQGDLVVDATGRASQTPEWLASMGYERPPESRIEINLNYTTYVFPRRPDDLDGDLAALLGATAQLPRGGAAIAMEDDRWIVGLAGYGEDRAGTDLDSFRDYARTLVAPDLADLVRDRKPLAEPRRYHFPSSRRRYYERLTHFPEGYLVVGDAICSFNPAYGQGMSVAALEALALRDTLREGSADAARRFFRRCAPVVDVAWDIAAGADLRLPVVPGPRPLRIRLVNAYVARVQAAAAHDPAVGRSFLRVVNLLDPPTTLMKPSVATRLVPRARAGDHDRLRRTTA